MRYIAALFIACSLHTSCSTMHTKNSAYNDVTGAWRLYEFGNDVSGGFNYIVKPVDSIPLQTIRLWTNGRFKATGYDPYFVDHYRPIRAYKIERTTAANTYTFSYWDKRYDKDRGLVIREGLVLRKDTLRFNPLCIEGCHFSFVKIKR